MDRGIIFFLISKLQDKRLIPSLFFLKIPEYPEIALG